jgi:hypothetical protein
VYAHINLPTAGLNHNRANTSLKNMTKLKYLGMAASNENYMHKDVNGTLYKEQSVNR